MADEAAWRNNPNYIITLTNHAAGVTSEEVSAYLPETFHFRLQNHWEPILQDALSGNRFGAAAQTIANIGGLSINPKFLTALIWRSTEPLHFQFTFQFDAIDSAKKDVTEKTKKLIRMTSPERDGVFLKAPGPTFRNVNNNISLRVGRFFWIDSVVINDLDITYYTASEEDGNFIAADAEVNLSSWYTPDRQDIEAYFGYLQGGVPGLTGDNPILFNPGQNFRENLQSLWNRGSEVLRSTPSLTPP